MPKDDAKTYDGKRMGIYGLLTLMKPYLVRHKLKIFFILLLVIISNLILLSIPTYTGRIIDAIGLGGGGADFSSIFTYSWVILGLALVGGGLEFLRNYMMVNVSQSIVFSLRCDVFEHAMNLPLAFLDSNLKGDIMNRMVIDTDQISETVTSNCITVLSGVVTVIGALAMMLRISPLLSLTALLVIPLLIAAARFISTQARKRYRVQKQRLAELSSHTEEMITSQRTVKLFGLEDYNTNKFVELSDSFEKAAQAAEFTSSTMMPTMNFLNNLSFVIISLAGCLMFLSGRLSIGNISGFIMYSKKFTAPIVETANLYGAFQSALASGDRINFLLTQPRESNPPNPVKPARFKGNVRFNDVCFSYLPDTPVIRDVSFTVKQGQKVAFVGKTGSGKTTLISLLMRFFHPDSGTITIDGIDIADMDLAELRKQFALVLQENFLFERSIDENVDYALDTGDSARIQSVLRDVGLEGFTDVKLLSQGQTQLLTIARALMTNPAIVVFDEATSAVDTVTEAKIQQVTEDLMRGKTTFIIAHRLSTIHNADLILVIDDGRVIEQGSHDSLIAADGAYAKLYNSQWQ